MPSPITVAVTGGAGQIGYSLVFALPPGPVCLPLQPAALTVPPYPPSLPRLHLLGRSPSTLICPQHHPWRVWADLKSTNL